MIIWNDGNNPPKSEKYDEPCGTYYLVKTERFTDLAMFLDNEWYKSYNAKIVEPVVKWSEINN